MIVHNNCDVELRHLQQQLMLKQHDHTNEQLRTSLETGRYLGMSKRKKPVVQEACVSRTNLALGKIGME